LSKDLLVKVFFRCDCRVASRGSDAPANNRQEWNGGQVYSSAHDSMGISRWVHGHVGAYRTHQAVGQDGVLSWVGWVSEPIALHYRHWARHNMKSPAAPGSLCLPAIARST